MYKFVNSDGGPSAQKRQQSQRACEPCRKRKKRCHHTSSTSTSTTPTTAEPRQSQTFAHGGTINNDPASTRPLSHSHTLSVTQSQSSPLSTAVSSHAPAPPQTTPIDYPRSFGSQNSQPAESRENAYNAQQSPTSPTAQSVRRLSTSNNKQESGPGKTAREATQTQQEINRSIRSPKSHPSRFIGDLNPESIFLAATSPHATRGVSLEDSIGVWLTTKLGRKASQQSPLNGPDQSPSNLFYGSASLVQKVLVPVLEQECLSTMPSPARIEALSRIYFERIHPIFPVIDESGFQSLHPTDPGRILLQQSICLAASKNFAARQLLVLAESGPPLTCREFGDRLSGVMRLSIEMGLVTNKMVLIQSLALMSQFIDGPDGSDISSLLCGRAVHCVQTIGLHLKGQQEDHRDKYRTTLLSCIWAIDRMNAAFNGRPVLMHERDVRKDMDQIFEQQDPCFRLFLQVVVLLDKVIELYRPVSRPNNTVMDWDFPSFEDVVVKCGGSHIGTSPLATIETLYHAVAILSCRSQTWADPQRSSISYLRQSLSTSSLTSTVGSELQDQLVLFPFLPYAMSLSLSIAYREMRHNKLPLHRARARAQFQTICDVLSELEGTFWSASTTAEMGRKLLKEMDRVFYAVSSSDNRRPQQYSNNNVVNVGNGYDSRTTMTGENPVEEGTITTVDSARTPMQPTQDFDPSIFDSMANVDLFGMFDPAFDLDGFDACLEGNLNLSFPTTF